MKISEYRVGFIGFGHIAQALFRAIDSAKLIPHSHIAFTQKDPTRSRTTQETFHITGRSLPSLLDTSDVLLICIPPRDAKTLFGELKNHENHIPKKVISLMAGISLQELQNGFGPERELLRAMPNIALSLGEGMTLLSSPSNASIELESFAHLLFSSAGKVLQIPERLMNLGTALAGSGPAFAIYLIDAMVRFGVNEGLSRSDSLAIAAQVFRGAAALILQHDPKDLLQQIATPGGTTKAGLDILQKTPSALHLQEALRAAAERAAQPPYEP